MVGWHHRHNGHEFEQTEGDGEGQGSLTCCIPWGHKETHTTEQLNNNSVHFQSSPKLLLGDKYFTCHFSKRRMLQ